MTAQVADSGSAGTIDIQDTSLALDLGSLIDSNTTTKTLGSAITVAVTDTLTIDNAATKSKVTTNASGMGGTITLNSDSLTLSNGDLISTTTSDSGLL